ncbi:MAG: response regulator transcription factor [Fidelibacterota bacterium]
MKTNMKIKILVADDSRVFRKKVIEILKKYSNLLILGEAENGEEAVNLAFQLNPDLIIMDVRMPDMDGINATAIIKKKLPQIKIIIVSIHDISEYKNAAVASGADAYILKRNIYNILHQEIKNIFRLGNNFS